MLPQSNCSVAFFYYIIIVNKQGKEKEMQNIFLDASVLKGKDVEETIKLNIQYNRIKFSFPDGFTQLRLIEECRALNALDLTNPDNFDLMYDITMQMLVGKVVEITLKNEAGDKSLAQFLVTDRYMDLRSVPVIDEYPVLVNWLVEFIAGYLGKKYPRSLKDFQARMSEREERMKSLKNQEEVKVL